MNQRQLGLAVGVSLQQIHKYECGASQISASRLWQIAAAVDCDISYFFEGVNLGADGGGSPYNDVGRGDALTETI